MDMSIHYNKRLRTHPSFHRSCRLPTNATVLVFLHPLVKSLRDHLRLTFTITTCPLSQRQEPGPGAEWTKPLRRKSLGIVAPFLTGGLT